MELSENVLITIYFVQNPNTPKIINRCRLVEECDGTGLRMSVFKGEA